MMAGNAINRIKTLHIVENMHRGAVENWLARIFRHARRQGLELDWTFYCQVGDEGIMDAELRSLGAKIIHSPVPIGEKLAFIKALRTELKRGKYDVLHCHHDLVSAVYLVAVLGLPIRRRLVHVHNADEAVPVGSAFKKYFLREPMRRTCLALADKIVGISNHSLDTFLRGRPRRPVRDLVHYYGIDSEPFRKVTADRDLFRRELELPPDSMVLLFASRLVPEKNPSFALNVLGELRKLQPRVVGVFVGSGSEEQPLRNRASVLGMEGATRFLGWRRDIPEIMACCDWFILPHPEHPMEGFGLAVVEAQLAGLRLLISPGIADDPLLPTACYARVPLASGPAAWARSANELLLQPLPKREEALTALAASPFNMDVALQNLLALYE